MSTDLTTAQQVVRKLRQTLTGFVDINDVCDLVDELAVALGMEDD